MVSDFDSSYFSSYRDATERALLRELIKAKRGFEKASPENRIGALDAYRHALRIFGNYVIGVHP